MNVHATGWQAAACTCAIAAAALGMAEASTTEPPVQSAGMRAPYSVLQTDERIHTQYAEPATWRLGGTLEAGDSYTYRVCGSMEAVFEIHPKTCHILQMDFVYGTTHHAYGQIWVVDVGFDGKRTVMFLDESMEMHPTSAWDRDMAASIQNTILHLAPYGEQSLEVGSHWGTLSAYFYDVPLSVQSASPAGAGSEATAVTVGYDTSEPSRTTIRSDVPFPLHSRWYESNSITVPPRLAHDYALLGD